jgi:hypothetical protein
VIVRVAVTDLPGSEVLVAIIVIVCVATIRVGAVYNPVLEMRPSAG